MPVPPLDPNWKPPENPNNPPLPKDWKPAANPNNPPLPRDGQPLPGGALSTQPPAGYIPAVGKRNTGGSGGSQPGYGAASPEGFYYGTNIKAPTQADTDAFRQGLGLAPSTKPNIDPQTGQVTASDAFKQRQAQLPFMQGQQQPQPFMQPGQQQAPMGMGMGGGNPLMPQGGYQSPQANQPQFDRQAPDPAYQRAYEELEKARQSVAADPRFSPEQRALAFQKIASRADELDQSFAEGAALKRSPYGMAAPPAEEFADVQGTGLQPMQDGRIRNPETGDIMRSVRAPNGQLVPVATDQVEVDALPEGTRYMDAATGKMMIAGASGTGGRSQAASAGGSRAKAQGAMTPEDAFAAFEKWGKANDVGTTMEERQVISNAIDAVADEDQRDQLKEMMKSDPQAAMDALNSSGVDIGSQLQQARIKAFARSQKERSEQTKQLAAEMGIEQPEEVKPPVDPNKYRTRVGNRGTMVVRRRGSGIDIPAEIGPDGQPRPAPRQMRQLADLEVDTEFANVVPAENGMETRVLPFGKQMVNLGDFALTDAQRKAFANETSQIEARRPEEWGKFEDLLQQFQTTDEVWDPNNPTPAQAKLEDIVGKFYGELQPEGKAMMTMYIAHSLGYKIDKNQPFSSTGWAKDQSKMRQGGTGIKTPTSYNADNMYSKLIKIGFTEDDKRAPEYQNGLSEMATNIWRIAEEQSKQTGGQSMYKTIDRLVAQTVGKPMTMREKMVADDLRETLRSWTEQTAPRGQSPAPKRPSQQAQTPAPTPAPVAQPQRRNDASQRMGGEIAKMKEARQRLLDGTAQSQQEFVGPPTPVRQQGSNKPDPIAKARAERIGAETEAMQRDYEKRAAERKRATEAERERKKQLAENIRKRDTDKSPPAQLRDTGTTPSAGRFPEGRFTEVPEGRIPLPSRKRN